MHRSGLVAHDLRRLFLGIARTAAAASGVAACAEEHGYLDEEEEPEDAASPADATSTPRDAQVARDAGPGWSDASVPYDAGPKDASVVIQDAGRPRDASVVPEAGPKDAGTPVDAGSGEWQTVPCANGVATPSAVLNTATRVDYLGVHLDYNVFRDSPVPALPDGGIPNMRAYAERARVGEACAGASNPTACEQELTKLKSGGPVCASNECRFVLVSSGGQSMRIDLRDALLARLGNIDTVAEAVLLAAFDGRQVCPGLRSDPRDIGLEIRPIPGGGYEMRATYELCSQGLFQDLFSVAPNGTLSPVSRTTLKMSSCAVGRRAPGACDSVLATASVPSAAAAYLAQSARLEAGSIYAFHQLIRELTAHGAPEALRLLALDALIDEVAHAHDVGALARQFGADVSAPEVRATPLRSLLELALDNAQEGCVRETFGALLATYQAEAAEDERVRALMAQVAQDETRHAALSWQLMAWLAPQLSEGERATVAAAQRQARAALADEFEFGLSEPERRTLGMPDARRWGELLVQMDGALQQLTGDA